MASYFPQVYENEALYSIISRYYMMSGDVSPKHTLEELFGKLHRSIGIDIACNLVYLANQIGIKKYNADYLIIKHTLYPYYYPFLPIDRRGDVYEQLMNSDSTKIHMRLGLNSGQSYAYKKNGLYYCPILF